jgi:hypothetical protein
MHGMDKDNGRTDDVAGVSLSEPTTTAAGLVLVARQVLSRLADVVERTVSHSDDLTGYSTVERAEIAALTQAVGSWAVNVWFIEQRRPTPEEATVLSDLARTRASQGVPLEIALVALQLGVTETWRLSVQIAHETGASPDVVVGFADRLTDFQRFATTTVVEVYADIEREAARRLESSRSDFIRALAQGTIPTHTLTARAAAHGLRVDAAYVAIRARSSIDGVLDPLFRQLRETRPGAHPPLLGYLDGDLVGVVDPRVEIDVADATVGLGPPALLSAIGVSFHLADRVVAAATSFGLVGAYRIEDVGLLPAVLADGEISELFIERRLSPLLDVQRFGEGLIDTLRVLLKNNMQIDAAARELVVHPNTLRHRLRRIEQLTDADLTKLETLFEFWWALRAHDARTAAT